MNQYFFRFLAAVIHWFAQMFDEFLQFLAMIKILSNWLRLN